MLPNEIEKIRNLVKSSPLLNPVERVEWLNLIQLMNDMQFLELRKILLESRDIKTQAPTSPKPVAPLKPPAAPNSGLRLDHILNAPKGWDNKTAGPIPAQKSPATLPGKIKDFFTGGKKLPAAPVNELLELTTSKPAFPLELTAVTPAIKPPASSFPAAVPLPADKMTSINLNAPKLPPLAGQNQQDVKIPESKVDAFGDKLQNSFPAGFSAPQKSPAAAVPLRAEKQVDLKPPISPILVPVAKLPPPEVAPLPAPNIGGSPESKQVIGKQKISLHMGQGSTTIINLQPQAEVDIPRSPGILFSSPPQETPLYQPPIPSATQPVFKSPKPSPPAPDQSGFESARIKQKIPDSTPDARVGLAAMPSNIHFKELGQAGKFSPMLLKKVDEALGNAEALAGLSLENFRKFGAGILFNKIKTFRDAQGYHEIIFFLEQSPVYKTYVKTGLKLLEQQATFEDLAQTGDKNYLNRQQFEDFTDLLRQLQA